MALKKILSVGFNLGTDDVQYCPFESDISLLDWDIILFRPTIESYLPSKSITLPEDTYQGKHSLSDSSSFKLKERSQHWRREILEAYNTGKTVLVFLTNFLEVYIDSGQRTYTGTGRNRSTTRHVALYNNYESIPVNIGPISGRGSAIKLSHNGADIIAGYWKEVAEYSEYKVTLTTEKIPACLLTKNGNKVVGAIYSKKNSPGRLLLLPDIEFNLEPFTEDGKFEFSPRVWTKKGKQFAAKLVSAVVSLDKAFKNSEEITPEPSWAAATEYTFENENKIRSELAALDTKVTNLQNEKLILIEELKNSSQLRNLLFEKGKPLEYAIIDSLAILGFKAEPYHEAESEFDVVFESSEGRLIGEAEGKDKKAINIDKLRQLAMNLHEDLSREEVDAPAKGVLFGNAYRLSPISERKDPFTEKCISAAVNSSTALIFTPDLFKVVHYLSNYSDESYAKECRLAIVNAVGRVKFSNIPKKTKIKLAAKK